MMIGPTDDELIGLFSSADGDGSSYDGWLAIWRAGYMAGARYIAGQSAGGTTVVTYEWGYRIPGREDVWEIDHGIDGTWTPYVRDLDIGSIDLDIGHEAESIRKALAAAGVEGQVICRKVMRFVAEPEVVDA